MFPLKAVDGGVRVRPGHTEAAVDLCKLSGLPLVACIAEICLDDGRMARRHDLEIFCEKHSLMMISIADLSLFLNIKN